MSEKYNEMIEYLKSLKNDVHKFYVKGQAAAGTRLRKGCQEVKNLCQDIRVEVSQLKNAETVSA